MKKHGVVYNRRKLRRGRNITRWVANGCNWQEGRDASVAQDARLELGSPRFLVQVGIEAEWLMQQLGDYVVTQSIAGAAVRAAQGDPRWGNRLIAMRQD